MGGATLSHPLLDHPITQTEGLGAVHPLHQGRLPENLIMTLAVLTHRRILGWQAEKTTPQGTVLLEGDTKVLLTAF